MRASVLVVGSLTLLTALAGCLSTSQPLDPGALPGAGQAVYDTSRGWSMPLAPGVHALLEPVKHFVESFDGTPMALGIVRPDIEGCDWDAASLPPACRLPIVMDAGPYYADHIDAVKYRPPLAEWLVPRGYAVVYMSVRGTGESGGCMEFMGPSEQRDVDHVVTWLSQQPWSNGNVGMMGRSYDGTTPFFPAALGNPALKTIVPISGVASQRDLMFKNGTSELRGPIMHSYVYWFNYGLGMADGGAPAYRAGEWASQACPEFVQGAVDGPLATITGDASSAYWAARDWRRPILENYKGSIWVVHGREDWNVNPSQVVPWIRDLQAAGIETKAWLGVWGHAYPDRVDEHRNVRWDWAEQTVRWFDHYLKGEGPKPALDVEVEDSLFVWRSEATYPPADAVMRDLEPGADGLLAERGEAAAGTFALGGTGGAGLGFGLGPGGTMATFTSEPLAADMRVAGLPQLQLTAAPTTPAGGWVFAELYDIFPDGRAWRVGWAAIDLRHHAGGNGAPATLAPGQPVVAMMEFEPTDHLFAAGHRVRLVLHRDGVEDILPSPSAEPALLSLGGEATVLRLPEVQRPTILPTYTPPVLAG